VNEAIDIEQYLALFAPFGGTASDYLRRHFPRYLATKRRLLSHWDRRNGVRMLDVGAHWLHQSLMYAIDGFEVSALDVPVTFDAPEVAALAAAHHIRLLRNPDLEHPTGLTGIADDSFDLILFTEIIEHIAFNPIAMWRELYRVLRPGGRIVLTTPNYYALRGLLRRAQRFLSGRGGGVDARSVLHDPTFAHHWKEYSRRELLAYFADLAPDFACVNCARVEEYRDTTAWSVMRKMVVGLEHLLPALRPDLYLEIELTSKQTGIVIEPHW
jgi:2-polyprenyl-6-hydroxyphenyl methylase/3-demethylubiquinone-9 3-methyltransferase